MGSHGSFYSVILQLGRSLAREETGAVLSLTHMAQTLLPWGDAQTSGCKSKLLQSLHAQQRDAEEGFALLLPAASVAFLVRMFFEQGEV